MARFYDTFINFMLIGLMVVSLFGFIIFLQNENNATDRMINNALMNETFTDLSEKLGGLEDESQAQKTLFESEKPTEGVGSILLFSIVSSGKVFNSMIIGVFNILIKLPVTFLGLNSVVVSVISTIVIITIIIGLWIIYKLGG